MRFSTHCLATLKQKQRTRLFWTFPMHLGSVRQKSLLSQERKTLCYVDHEMVPGLESVRNLSWMLNVEPVSGWEANCSVHWTGRSVWSIRNFSWAIFWRLLMEKNTVWRWLRSYRDYGWKRTAVWWWLRSLLASPSTWDTGLPRREYHG